MVLTKHQTTSIRTGPIDGGDRVFHYGISGLPPGEHAFIAEFPHEGWRILRWNDNWHGNWSGNYPTAESALNALRAELSAVT